MLHYRQALKINPNQVDTHYYQAHALAQTGRRDEAVQHLRQVLRIKSDNVAATNDLAWILATDINPTFRDVNEAVLLAEHACELTTNAVTLCLDTWQRLTQKPGGSTTLPQSVLVTWRQPEAKKFVMHMENTLKLHESGRMFHESVGTQP